MPLKDILQEKNLILNKENQNIAQKLYQQIIDLGIDFKLQDNFKQKNFDEKINEEIYNYPIEGIDLENLINLFKEEILPFCANFSSEKFMGFPDSGNSLAGIAGSILSDFLQQNLINSSFCSPIGTHIEIAVIQWLRQVIGFAPNKINDITDVGGVITYGGTVSNSIAMLLARENHIHDTMKNGVIKPDKYKVILPKGIGHYSIKSSLMWIGCGNHTIEVPTSSYRYNLEALKETLEQNRGEIMF